MARSAVVPSLCLALVLGGGSASAAPALDVKPDDYRRAAASGALGAVCGRAVGETGRRAQPERALADVSITVLPRSEALLQRLAAIKTQARRDMEVYRESARRIAEARRELERALTEAGAGDLVKYTAVDPDGTFEVQGLPAGQWVVLAQHSEFVKKETPAPGPRESAIYRREPRLKGYYTVTLWVREVTIAAGRSATLMLTDRNAWLTAIAEDRQLDAGQPPPRRRPAR